MAPLEIVQAVTEAVLELVMKAVEPEIAMPLGAEKVPA